MRKLTLTAVNLLAAGITLMGNAQAQQTPAANTQQAPAAKAAPAPAAGAQKAPASKTGQLAKPRTQPVLTLKTQKDKVSYALGANLGMNLHNQSVDVDTAIVLRGLKDALAGGKLLLTDDEAKAALTQLQTDLRNKQMEKMKEAADLNKKAGTYFLEANKAKEGVVTLPSGLQYKILTAGTGPKPAATDTVSCNYGAPFWTVQNSTALTSVASQRHFLCLASSRAGRKLCSSCPWDRSGNSLFPRTSLMGIAARTRARASALARPSFLKWSCFPSKTKPNQKLHLRQNSAAGTGRAHPKGFAGFRPSV